MHVACMFDGSFTTINDYDFILCPLYTYTRSQIRAIPQKQLWIVYSPNSQKMTRIFFYITGSSVQLAVRISS